MVIEGVRFFPSTTLLHCNVYRWVESKNSLSLSLLSDCGGLHDDNFFTIDSTTLVLWESNVDRGTRFSTFPDCVIGW